MAHYKRDRVTCDDCFYGGACPSDIAYNCCIGRAGPWEIHDDCIEYDDYFEGEEDEE